LQKVIVIGGKDSKMKGSTQEKWQNNIDLALKISQQFNFNQVAKHC
jgi:hypothetical protein